MEHKKRSGGQNFKKSSGGGARKSSGAKKFGGPKNSRGRSGSRGGQGGRRGGGRRIPTFDPTKFVNTNPVDVKEEVYNAKNSFADFGFDIHLAKTLTRMGIETPSPIQDQTIAASMEGRDVVGLAETGTGKTAAFLLPLIHKTLNNNNHETLILAPTRELALQINQELRLLGKGFKIYSTVLVGGTNIAPQIRAMKRTHHFVIGTPGRILDLIKRKAMRTDTFDAVVLDEADRMLDMGFIHDIKSILQKTPEDRQTLFFSATMDDKTKTLIHDFLKDPVIVSVKKKDVTNSIEQNIVPHGHHDKFRTLINLLSNAKEFEQRKKRKNVEVTKC